MFRFEYKNEMPYIFDNERKGAKYSMDNGATWKNGGEFIESAIKFHLGLDYLVNPATTYDEGSDIESLNASVKSSKASLACIYGDSFNAIVNEYFENVHSTLWIYGIAVDESIIEYHMNKAEFKEFVEAFGKLEGDSKAKKNKVRFKATSATMVQWFESRV